MLPKDADPERRLEIFERAKRFEDKVADVFQLLGYRTIVDYKLDDRTFQELLLSLVDLTPHADAAVRGYEGTDLERLYVEQDVLLQSDRTRRRPLLAAVREWIGRDGGTLFTLLGDFGSGKTSFCQRLVHDLAKDARDDPNRRRPFLVDLREGGSTTVTLENLLVHAHQYVASLPLNPRALLRLNDEGHLGWALYDLEDLPERHDPERVRAALRVGKEG